MKRICIIINLSLFFSNVFAQKINSHNFSFYLSGGVSNEDTDPYFFGSYFKTGIKKQVYKRLHWELHYIRTKINTFPRKFHVYSFNKPDEQAIIDYWKGRKITTSDWLGRGKGFFEDESADVFAFNVDYALKISNNFFVEPKIGVAKINSLKVMTGLFEIQTDLNSIVLGGKVGYDIRYTSGWGVSYGINLNCVISKHFTAFLDIQFENLNPQLNYNFNYYNGRQGGLGISYNLTPSPMFTKKNR